MTDVELQTKLGELLRLPTETEWIQFKRNNENPQEVGEYQSAISNGAASMANALGIWCGELETVLLPLWAPPEAGQEGQ